MSNTENNKKIDNPFDIRDDGMEIDDSVLGSSSGADLEDDAVATGSENWQSELVTRAQAAGLPADVIAKLQGPDAVNDLLTIITSGLTKKEVQVDPPQATQSSEFQLDIDEATAFDPDAARAMRSMNDFYTSKIRQLEQLIVQNGRSSQGSGTQSFAIGLGKEWASTFGTASAPNQENIARLDDSIQTIRAGYAARNKRAPSEADLNKMALSASFGDQTSEIARNKFTEKVNQRSSQIVARPGTRTAPPSNPRLRAAQGVADWFKAKGIDPYGETTDTFS